MRKLEIGPGNNPLGNDWEAMDMVTRPHVQHLHDIRKMPYPFDPGTFDIIYMSHILEHIPWFQTVDCLNELRRITKPGGVVEIWVPDLEKLVKAYLDPSLVQNDGWYKFNPEKDPTKWFNGRLFTYGPGEENWHRAAFDFRYLEKCLKDAGFSKVERLQKRTYGGVSHGWIDLGVRATN